MCMYDLWICVGMYAYVIFEDILRFKATNGAKVAPYCTPVNTAYPVYCLEMTSSGYVHWQIQNDWLEGAKFG